MFGEWGMTESYWVIVNKVELNESYQYPHPPSLSMHVYVGKY